VKNAESVRGAEGPASFAWRLDQSSAHVAYCKNQRWINNVECVMDRPRTAYDYKARAVECARLANMNRDSMIQATLLRRREMYLKIAKNLAIVSDARAKCPRLASSVQ
jgi:hypothetical protein